MSPPPSPPPPPRPQLPTPVSNTTTMLSTMTPTLHLIPYIYVTLPSPPPPTLTTALLASALAIFNEPTDGLSAIVPVPFAQQHPDAVQPSGPEMSHIELRVYSSLEGIGLTAAVATALTEAGVPCNVVAALRHDHVLVPRERAAVAMSALKRVAKATAGGEGARAYGK